MAKRCPEKRNALGQLLCAVFQPSTFDRNNLLLKITRHAMKKKSALPGRLCYCLPVI